MRKIVSALFAAALLGVFGAFAVSLEEGFARPPAAYRPWCYWWWINGHADKETITADLEAMKRLGFGGLLMFDSRGYWDDERHIVNPKPEIAFMSPEWQELVVFAIREAARLGLEFTMNMSSSGGKLDGPWEVGEDAPKRLVYKYCASPESARGASLSYRAAVRHHADERVQVRISHHPNLSLCILLWRPRRVPDYASPPRRWQ